MLNIELDGSEPEHVERIEPRMSTDAQGNVSWVPSLLDHNAKVFHRGKTVTNEEFNELFLHQVYRGNYLTDSLSKFFGSHLSNAIRGKFRSDFKLVPSYIKTFTSADWGTLQDDGYYYISIPAEEHGFTIDPEEAALDRINIDIEMYLLSPEGLFYEVTQAHIDTDNTVQIYTDDNTIPGFIVIRANEKAYALVDVTIGANQVDGLHAVATSGKYTDLIDINAANGPNTKIKQNTTAIQAILDGYKIVDDVQEEVRVALADKANEAADADNLTGSINNIDIKDIFEDNATSYIVKEATLASNYKAGGSIESKFNEIITNVQNGIIIANNAQNYTTSGGIATKFSSIDTEISNIKNGTTIVANAAKLAGYTLSNSAADIHNSSANKVMSAQAIKQFMEEYYMQSQVGNVTAINSVIGSLTNPYLVKQGNEVTLTLPYNSTDSITAEKNTRTVLHSVQLPEGFYRTDRVISVIPKVSAEQASVARSFSAEISSTGVCSIIFTNGAATTQYVGAYTYELHYII